MSIACREYKKFISEAGSKVVLEVDPEKYFKRKKN
jgi:hypothetical protein